MKYIKSSKKGVTLVELIVVLGLIGILSLGLFQIYDVIKNQNNKIDYKSKLQFEAQFINEELFEKISEAKEIVKIDRDNNSNVTNSFIINTLNKNKNSFIPCTFEIKENELLMIYDGETKKLSDKIKFLKLKNVNREEKLDTCKYLEIEIDLVYHTEEYKIQEKIKFRNNNA